MKKLQVKASFFLKDKGRFFKVITVRSSMARGVAVLNGISYLSHLRFSVLTHISYKEKGKVVGRF